MTIQHFHEGLEYLFLVTVGESGLPHAS